MITLRFLFIPLLALTLAPSLLASTGSSAASRLQLAMKHEISLKSSGPGPGSASANQLRNLLNQLPNAISQSALGQTDLLRSILDQISETSTDPTVREAVEDARTEAEMQLKARDELFVKTSNETATRLGLAALSATAAEIDPMLKEASALVSSYRSDAPEAVRNAAVQNDSLKRFLTDVQDYRFYADRGDIDRVNAAIRNLQNGSGIARTFLPRSRLLSLLNPIAAPEATVRTRPRLIDEKGEQLLRKIHYLEDIDPAIQAWTSAYRLNEFTTSQIVTLGKWSALYRDLRAGTTLSVTVYQLEDGAGLTFAGLRNQLIATSIGAQLGLLATFPPGKDEAATAYLDRIFLELKKRGDYALLKRAAETSQIFMHGNYPYNIYPRYTGLCAYFAAQSQAQAQQWMAAVISYQRALRDGGDFVPTAEIGQRLQEIQSSQPVPYHQGMAAFFGDASPRIANVYLSIVPDSKPAPAPAPATPPKK